MKNLAWVDQIIDRFVHNIESYFFRHKLTAAQIFSKIDNHVIKIIIHNERDHE